MGDSCFLFLLVLINSQTILLKKKNLQYSTANVRFD